MWPACPKAAKPGARQGTWPSDSASWPAQLVEAGLQGGEVFAFLLAREAVDAHREEFLA